MYSCEIQRVDLKTAGLERIERASFSKSLNLMMKNVPLKMNVKERALL